MTTALKLLLLHDWPGAGHKAINHHCPPCHHVFTLIRFSFGGANKFGSYFLNFLNGSFEFDRGHGFNRCFRLRGGLRLNGLVCSFSTMLRHTLGKFVLYRGKFVSTDVPWTKVMSLAYCESWGKEVRVSYVNIG